MQRQVLMILTFIAATIFGFGSCCPVPGEEIQAATQTSEIVKLEDGSYKVSGAWVDSSVEAVKRSEHRLAECLNTLERLGR